MLCEEAGEYHVTARKDYAAGEQVFLCYGKYTNLELLEHYGFLFDRNDHDRAHLAVELLPQLRTLPLSDCWVHPGVCGARCLEFQT